LFDTNLHWVEYLSTWSRGAELSVRNEKVAESAEILPAGRFFSSDKQPRDTIIATEAQRGDKEKKGHLD
jgi:hypothetical protein